MKLRLLLSAVIFMTFTANADSSAVYVNSINLSGSHNIFPEILSGTQSTELGDFIFSAMPDKGKSWTWDWQSDNPNIKWNTDLSNDMHSIPYYSDSKKLKSAYLRINVLGNISSERRGKKNELGWTLVLSTDADDQTGPNNIKVAPSRDCFGPNYSNCEFGILASLKKKDITTNRVCHTEEGQEVDNTYVLSSPGKENIVASMELSGGSGGDSGWLTLAPYHDMPALAEICKKNYDATHIIHSDASSDDQPPLSQEIIEQQQAELTKIIDDALINSLPKTTKVCHMDVEFKYQNFITLNASKQGNDLQLCSQVIDILRNIKIPDKDSTLSVAQELRIN